MGNCASLPSDDVSRHGTPSSVVVRVSSKGAGHPMQGVEADEDLQQRQQTQGRKQADDGGHPADHQHGDPPSRSRSHSRSRSRSSRRRRKRGDSPEPLDVMDPVAEERRHVLDDPSSMSYRPPAMATLSPPMMVQQASTSSDSINTGSLPSSFGGGSSGSAHSTSSLLDSDIVVVLVCDEDELIQACLEKWLSYDRHYQIVPCCSGDEAIEVLALSEFNEHTLTNDISFIIADGNMLTPSGALLLDWLQAEKSTASIPAILMCAEGTSSQETDRLIRRGATDIVRKPLNKVALLNSIDTLFRTKMDGQKSDLLRDKGDEFKRELLREQRTGGKELGSMKNGTLSGFTVGEDAPFEAIHVLVIDSDSRADPSAPGQVHLSPQATKIQEWIGSMVLNVLVAPSCAAAIETMDAMMAAPGLNQQQQPRRLVQGPYSSGGMSGTIQMVLSPDPNDSPPLAASNSRSLLGVGPSSGGAPAATMINKPTLFGVELIVCDFDLIEHAITHTDATTTTATTNGAAASSSDGASPPLSPSPSSPPSDGKLLIQRILTQPQLTPIVLLVDDVSDVTPAHLALFKQCSVTFVTKPLGRDVFSQKIGLLVESIQQDRQKQRYAYRAASYRVMLQKMRERKKQLGVSNRESLTNTMRANSLVGGGGDASASLSQQPAHGTLRRPPSNMAVTRVATDPESGSPKMAAGIHSGRLGGPAGGGANGSLGSNGSFGGGSSLPRDEEEEASVDLSVGSSLDRFDPNQLPDFSQPPPPHQPPPAKEERRSSMQTSKKPPM